MTKTETAELRKLNDKLAEPQYGSDALALIMGAAGVLEAYQQMLKAREQEAKELKTENDRY